MTYRFPPQIDQLFRQQMASGNYASEDELLEDALRALRQRNEDLAAIQEGIDNMEAGRVEPFLSAAEEVAKKHSFYAPLPSLATRRFQKLNKKRPRGDLPRGR